jgi:hypothetical protein
MALHTPNNFVLQPCFCHICYEEVRNDQHGIEHSGHGQMTQTRDPRFGPLHDFVEGHMTLWFHPECATVMALRLSHDVMRIKGAKDQPKRVVDGLQALAKVNLAR